MIRNGKKVKFRVYRKPTNRENYVHFFSGHSDRVKRGIVIGFFLRAFRICSDEFLQDEIKHIYTSFTKLKYPKGLLIYLKNKAIKIRAKTSESTKRKSNVKYVSIPNSGQAETIAKHLEGGGMKVAIVSGAKVGEMLSAKKTNE